MSREKSTVLEDPTKLETPISMVDHQKHAELKHDEVGESDHLFCPLDVSLPSYGHGLHARDPSHQHSTNKQTNYSRLPDVEHIGHANKPESQVGDEGTERQNELFYIRLADY